MGDENWLRGDDDRTINNLAIEDCDKTCDHRGKGAAPKNQRKKQPKRSPVKSPRHLRAACGSSKCETPSPPPSVRSSVSSVISSGSGHSVHPMHPQRAHTASAQTAHVVQQRAVP